jgi:hypothetical protein
MISIHWAGLLLAVHVLPVQTAELKPAPARMQSAIFLKLLAFHKRIASSDSVVVHVIGDDDFAAELRGSIGRQIGASVLKDVHVGNALPAKQPSAIYVSNAQSAGEVLAYTREHDVLSMTGSPELVERGVTLGVGIDVNRVKVLYNAASAREEDATWEKGLFILLDSQK